MAMSHGDDQARAPAYNILPTQETKSYSTTTDAGEAQAASSTFASSKQIANPITSAINVAHGKKHT